MTETLEQLKVGAIPLSSVRFSRAESKAHGPWSSSNTTLAFCQSSFLNHLFIEAPSHFLIASLRHRVIDGVNIQIPQ